MSMSTLNQETSPTQNAVCYGSNATTHTQYTDNQTEIVEMDVNDMYTNISTTDALQALRYSLNLLQNYTRSTCLAISKVHKLFDAIGKKSKKDYHNLDYSDLIKCVEFEAKFGNIATAPQCHTLLKATGLPMGSSCSPVLSNFYCLWKEIQFLSGNDEIPLYRLADNLYFLYK